MRVWSMQNRCGPIPECTRHCPETRGKDPARTRTLEAYYDVARASCLRVSGAPCKMKFVTAGGRRCGLNYIHRMPALNASGNWRNNADSSLANTEASQWRMLTNKYSRPFRPQYLARQNSCVAKTTSARRASLSDAPWKLVKAWRTDARGRTLENYPVP